jgi:RNA polymerase sigma-70 factor (ECF subfamily)
VSLRRPASPPTDDDLAARIRAGDAAVFERLFREAYAPLCGFAVRLGHEPAVAEEVVQELFADLWARRAEWAVRGSVRAYLFAALRNRALNLRRRRGRERDWAAREGVAEVRALHAAPEGADERLERQELHARLERALDALPERCRLAMRLRWREQWSHAEIAHALGITVKGVESQLARGLQALRARVGR